VSSCRRLEREIAEIDEFFYGAKHDDPHGRYSMMERKRDDIVRSIVLQMHTAIEDLMDSWLTSVLLDVPARDRKRHGRWRRVASRAVGELLNGGRAIGFDNKVRLLLGLGLIRRPLHRQLTELNQLRNRCGHNWLLNAVVRRGTKPHLPKRPLLSYEGGNLHRLPVLKEFCGDYGTIYFRLFGAIYAD
jgi:hypothetical protein